MTEPGAARPGPREPAALPAPGGGHEAGRHVRVRFAPSPTGWLHVGGARTAYFNWLFARQARGVMVLRIEDTDVARSTSASEAGVLGDLAWLGLDWDEGPDRGGPHGPYRQSERFELYRERVTRLLAREAAYPCFCTDAELEDRRQAALAAGQPPQYDGRCRRLTGAEREARIGSGLAASIRFEVPASEVVLPDLVRGEVRFPPGMVGDFVLMRSNGLPTYNFACVVDDHDMRISHVIRAEEHLANTPRQLMLYAAFGLEPPLFAHVPLILNRDRTKMSKRSGEAAVAVGDWRRDGYVPEALLSYLALLGFHPGDDREILSRDELLQAFTLARVGASGSVFDPDKLKWVNAHYLHHADGARLLDWIERELGTAPAGAAPTAPPAQPSPSPAIWAEDYAALAGALPRPVQQRALELVHGNIATLADVPVELSVALLDPPDLGQLDADGQAALSAPGAADVCAAFAAALRTLADWHADAIKSTLQQVGQQQGRKGRELFQPVRVALTGRTHGPELPLIVEFRGRERCDTDLVLAAAWSRERTRG